MNSSMLIVENDEIFLDWLDSATIVNAPTDLSPVETLLEISDSDSGKYIQDDMSKSLRKAVFASSDPDAPSSRPRSVLFDVAINGSSCPSPTLSGFSRSEGISSPGSNVRTHSRRHSTSSVASCSSAQTHTAPVRSILSPSESCMSMKKKRSVKRSPPSVKFVDAPTVMYENEPPVLSPLPPPTREKRRTREKITVCRWIQRVCRGRSPPQRPTISGPYRLSRSPSHTSVNMYAAHKTKFGKIKKFWLQMTSVGR